MNINYLSKFAIILLLTTGSLSAQNPDLIRIGICSDVHLPTMHDSENRITTFIDSMKIAKPDFIIELGDFGTPEKKYAPLFDIWNSYPGAKYNVIGNHEMDGGTTLDQAVAYLKIPNSWYSFDKNGFHFIVLDGNNKKNAESKGYKQFIGPEQMDWLKEDLAKTEHPVVIFSHQGLAFVPGAVEGYGVENYREVQQILEAHNTLNPANKVIASFNGHSHFDYAEKINDIWYITITSMAYHWLGDNYVKVRYSDEVDKIFKWIKYTAPFKEPLFTVVEISTKGFIKMSGKKSEWVGPSPWELGYPVVLKKYMRPAISERVLEFSSLPGSLHSGKSNTIESKINDLLSQMTLAEKVDFVSGLGFKTKKIERLGIPEIVMTDGGIGPNRGGKSTNYSATINLAAAFDTKLMRQVAENMGEETHIAKSDMLLAPMVNIIRTPFGGRAFELFSEDPYLTSRMCVEFVKGVQSKNIITCTKVIAVNNQEWNRFDVDVKVRERALQEIYLPAMKAAVQEADAWSIMAAYNSINGDYGCENKHLLTDILKDEWGFTGAVVSDWGGARSTVKMANSGLDLEMPVALYYGDSLLHAVKEKLVEEKVLDDKVKRLLRMMFKAGLFEKPDVDYGPSDTPERRSLALTAAQKSIVLLKNENNLLPLKSNGIKSIAVIGPNGDVAQMSGGGSGFLEGNYGISPLDGIKAATVGKIDVRFERGISLERMELPIAPKEYYFLPDGNPGIKAEYFNNPELEGVPAITRTEESIDFDWGFGDGRDPGKPGSPEPGTINLNKWSARWTGKFKSPGQGWYEIGIAADNGVRLYLDGKEIFDYWIDSRPGKFKIAKVEFKAGYLYDIKIEFYENIGSCCCKLGFAPFDTSNQLKKAVKLARESELVVLCLGLNKELEGESTDREELGLPTKQLNLLREIAKVNPNTIVVLYNATPILMTDWIAQVPAVIEAFYPGQEGGNALAHILFGDVNPSGKLPITLMKRWEDSPAYGTYPGTKKTADYREGIFVGYRHFDKENIEPMFPFGYGLSYTTFEYSGIRVDKPVMEQNDTIMVSITVRNTGKMDGDEVIQLYIHDVNSSVEREVKSLKGFERVNLKTGESKEISFTIDKSHLSFYDTGSNSWVAEPGQFEVLIGSSSRDIRATSQFTLK